MDQISDREMGDKYSYSHQNGGGVSSGKLRHGGLCDPTGVNLSATRDEIYETSVCGSGKSSTGIFLPRLFFGKSETPPLVLGTLSKLPINKSVLGLHKTVKSAAETYTSSLHASYKMIGEVTCDRRFSNADHLQ